MKITEAKFFPKIKLIAPALYNVLEMKAMCDITFDYTLIIRNIRIYEDAAGIKVAFPSCVRATAPMQEKELADQILVEWNKYSGTSEKLKPLDTKQLAKIIKKGNSLIQRTAAKFSFGRIVSWTKDGRIKFHSAGVAYEYIVDGDWLSYRMTTRKLNRRAHNVCLFMAEVRARAVCWRKDDGDWVRILRPARKTPPYITKRRILEERCYG